MPRPFLPRGNTVVRLVWMRRLFAMFALAGAAAGGWPPLAPRAAAEASRALYVAPVIGVRTFESKLDLETEAAIGLRLGAGVNDRVTVWMDAVHSVPARKTTGRLAYVTALRGLAQIRFTHGTVRPYLLAGVGGVLFNFSDANDTAAGEVTVGGGVEYRASPRVQLFAEWSGDFYRARTVVYGSTGNEISSSPRSTDAATTIAAGLAVGF